VEIVAKDQKCKMFHRKYDRIYASSNTQLTIISLNCIKFCVRAVDMQSIFCDVGTEMLYYTILI